MFHPQGPTFRELIHQALVSTEHGYDLIAPKFDFTPFRTPDPIVAELARVIGPPGSLASALDVCCGTGAALRFLRPLCRERVTGIDFSAGMLDEARRRLADAPGTAPIELVRGDAFDLPFRAEFDVVTCVGALGHVDRPDEDRFVAGIARALRPGGRFVFATTRPPEITQPWFWLAHGFNAVMRIRNALRSPPFIMYYLTFQWPAVQELLARHGFLVEVYAPRCPPPYDRAVIVSAQRR